MDRPIRLAVAVLAAVCAGLLVLVGPAPPRPADVDLAAGDGCVAGPALDGAATTNKVLDELGVSRIPASYVFVIDVSQSMQRSGLYPKVLTALEGFLRAIDSKDQVGVVIFAQRAETALALAPLTSVSAPHLPAVVDGLRLVASGDLPVLATGLPTHIDLAPGQTVEHAVRLDWSPPRDSGWLAGSGRYDTKLSLVAQVASPLADRLQPLPLPEGAPEFATDILGGPGLLLGLAPLSWNPWPLLVLLILTGIAVLGAARRWPSMTGKLEIYRMEERGGHDVEILVVAIPLHGRLRRMTVGAVDARSPNTAARIVVRAHRHLLTGVVRLRVGIRFTALRRGTRRDMAEWGRLLILGLDVRHVPAQQQLSPDTAVLTQPVSQG